jgi:hypothetical protein
MTASTQLALEGSQLFVQLEEDLLRLQEQCGNLSMALDWWTQEQMKPTAPRWIVVPGIDGYRALHILPGGNVDQVYGPCDNAGEAVQLAWQRPEVREQVVPIPEALREQNS